MEGGLVNNSFGSNSSFLFERTLTENKNKTTNERIWLHDMKNSSWQMNNIKIVQKQKNILFLRDQLKKKNTKIS